MTTPGAPVTITEMRKTTPQVCVSLRPRSRWAGALRRCVAAIACSAAVAGALARAPALDAALRARIDAFVEAERRASGLPGVALAIVNEDGAVHVRGFGHDGRGRAVGPDTPFPIGSLTKSFTALLLRQSVEAGELDVDAPVQRYLPWFRVLDADASAHLTLRQLLNQTSGLSRADGMAALLSGSDATVEELARGLRGASLAHPPGVRFEYSNLNFVLLGAVLEATTRRPWGELVRERILRPSGMAHTYTDHAAAREAGMTALHRMCFGVPVAHRPRMARGLAAAGGLVASAGDMATYLRVLLSGGDAPGGRLISPEGVAQLLAPASPPGRSRLMSADFAFRYGEGWFIGPFGTAGEARWHLGNLPSFVAWMVLLPDTRQGVAVLVNANTELPFGEVNAVMSRLPIGVVNLLRGQPAPQGPSLRAAYRAFDITAALAVVAGAAMAWRAARARRAVWAALMLLAALAAMLVMRAMGLGAGRLAAFAPDLALALATMGALLCLPAPLRALSRLRRRLRRGHADASP